MSSRQMIMMQKIVKRTCNNMVNSTKILPPSSLRIKNIDVSELCDQGIKSFEYKMNASSILYKIDKMIQVLNDLFDKSDEETFEDGMDTYFSINLRRIIKENGENAVMALHIAMSSHHANIEIIEEALRQIGSMDDKHTHNFRLNLLKRQLKSSDLRVRDAASIGIEAMGDPDAIASLQDAIDNEQHKQLKKNLKAVLTQLQE